MLVVYDCIGARMIIVISLGGSLVNTKDGIDKLFLGKLRDLIKSSKNKFGIVTGGGYKARIYANKIRAKGGNEYDADIAAIKATKENAKELIKALGGMAYSKVPSSFEEAKKALSKNKVVVMGGTIPGITTDTDSVLLAECVRADKVINLSRAGGIYNKDPTKFKDAKKFDKISHQQLTELAFKSDERKAGTNFIFDLMACKLASRSKLELHFIKSLEDLEKIIEKKKHSGTIIS